MSDEVHIYRPVMVDRRETFVEIVEVIANRALDLAKAGGSIISVSHAVDPADPEGKPFSVIVVGEAPEEVKDVSDIKLDEDPSGGSS